MKKAVHEYAIRVTYEYKHPDGRTIRNSRIAYNDEELATYIRRIAAAKDAWIISVELDTFDPAE